MKKSHGFFLVCMVTLTIVCIGWVGQAKAAETAPDPAVCDTVQKSLDRVVSISESASLSDKEKLQQLSAVWAQSWAELQASAAKDAQTAKIAQELGTAIRNLLALTKKSDSSGNRDATEQEQLDLRMIKQLAKPYVAIMRLLCPELRVPKAATD